MDDTATVSAADIARLAGVRRAAVSNWRRRHDDFPRPVGGTASSPLFSLPAVQAWLSSRGRPVELAPIDRAWQRLRALGDDLDLGERVADAGDYLAHAGERPDDDPELLTLLTEVATTRGAAWTFEQLCERYFEAHARRVSPTPPAYASLMVRLAGANGTTVLDPACGFGTLLLEAGQAHHVQGQDSDPTTARIAALRLRLHGTDTEIHVGDSLREDAFAGQQADVVLCDPPFNERAWGHEELVGDPRWEYGLPPRGESELAWVQHCLARVKPGGTVAILMPGAAAGRRSGKRIRANLLRAGALRAVLTLAPGTDLWLLTRPAAGSRAPATVLLAETTVDDAEALWRQPAENGTSVLDLLDDDVDLTPAQRRTAQEDPGQAFLAAQRLFGRVGLDLPPLLPTGEEPPHTTIGELVKVGALEIHHTPARAGDGDEPVLTLDDVLADRGPTGYAAPDDAAVIAREGDVIASVTGAVKVHSGPPTRLGAALSLYRVDPAHLDAEFLAGCLRAADFPVHSASTRIDARRLKVPRYPLAEQRAYGAAFRALAEFDRALRETAEIGRDLVRLGFAALAEGRLRPGA
ncbi:N-6 DNA methylase [Amycolatopsis rhabdoformis]|uniref:N-6 DNA methylase n=1 Tax=Amycolatopsis rhabdoformis TaxID=1448059 RepID=A0ABZ1I0H8_9PSEU|nr:N-6 DNA methylase [Amycolatopsis rhabdoformis]WSE27907.1 N-6 DNA methylase [Amycolatopsis rhabdoformis]